MKFKLEEGLYGVYYVLYKRKWWHSWKYIKTEGEDGTIRYWDTSSAAVNFINEKHRNDG